MARIDYFFSPISPFTYLAGSRLEEIAARHGATISYKPIDILALFGRTGGTPPPQRHESRQKYRMAELRRIATRTGMPINLQPAHFPTNAAPAAYAIIAAQKAQKAQGGDVGALVRNLLRACWAEDRDIAEDAVIKDCLAAAGFDPSLADTGLLDGAETYAANLEEAISKGVFGSPFYIVDGEEPFWGQDRLDDLELHLDGKI